MMSNRASPFSFDSVKYIYFKNEFGDKIYLILYNMYYISIYIYKLYSTIVQLYEVT